MLPEFKDFLKLSINVDYHKKLEDHEWLTIDNQFGFKPKHGTGMCIFLLKQTVSYYVNKETPVFSTFLDASKAFDRTNHNLLFAKLIKRNVSMRIVRLLLSWYRQQTMQVKWVPTTHPLYSNQWGKARESPEPIRYLFAVYLDELSIKLGSARVGCTVGNMVVNHLKFADDICVCSPSTSGLQCLLNICGDYTAEHEIIFNCNKTIGVLFCPKKYKQPASSNVFLNGVRVQFLNQVKYLGVWINASLKDDDDIQRRNHYTVQQTNSRALLISALLQ